MCVPMFVPEKELHTAYRVRRRRRRRRWRRKRRRRRRRATTMPIPRLGPRFTEMFSVGLVLGFRVWVSFAANLQVVFEGFVWRLRFGCSYGLCDEAQGLSSLEGENSFGKRGLLD